MASSYFSLRNKSIEDIANLLWQELCIKIVNHNSNPSFGRFNNAPDPYKNCKYYKLIPADMMYRLSKKGILREVCNEFAYKKELPLRYQIVDLIKDADGIKHCLIFKEPL
jgi:hypothetical protein